MIVNYGPASQIANNEILLRLKEIEDGRYEDTTRMSEIELELDGITSTVSEVYTDSDGSIIKSSELKQTVNELSSAVSNIDTEMDTKIESKVTQTADSLSVTFATKDELAEEVRTINATIDGIQMGGDMSITWDSLDEETRTKINDAIEASDAAYEKADGVEAISTANANLLDSFMYGSTTYIDGSKIYTGSLYSNAIHLGGELTVYTTATGSTSCGYLGGNPSLNDGSPGVHFLSKNKKNECAVTNNGVALRVSSNEVALTGTDFAIDIGSATYQFTSSLFSTPYVTLDNSGISPRANGSKYCGLNNYRWANVYSVDVNASNKVAATNGFLHNGTAVTSDIRLKNSIEELPEKYIVMFDNITAKRYKMNENTSDRYHVGFISQEVEAAMNLAGIDSQEFGGFVIEKDEEGNEKYMLRYDEFIGILTAKIKQLESRIEQLEAQ